MDMGQTTTTILTEETGMNHLGEEGVIMTVTGIGNSRSGTMNSLQGQEHTEVILDGRNPEGIKGKKKEVDQTIHITTKEYTKITREIDMKRQGALQEINLIWTITKEEETEVLAPE